MSNVSYCLNFWWPHGKTSNKTLKHKKIALRFRDRKLLLFFEFYPPRSQKPSMNFHVYTGLFHQINGKYAWKYFNCSAILMLVCRKPVQKYFGMLRPLPRPRSSPCPPAFPHSRCSYCYAICIIMWHWGLLSHACIQVRLSSWVKTKLYLTFKA